MLEKTEGVVQNGQFRDPGQNFARNTQDEDKRNKKHNAECWTPLYR